MPVFKVHMFVFTAQGINQSLRLRGSHFAGFGLLGGGFGSSLAVGLLILLRLFLELTWAGSRGG